MSSSEKNNLPIFNLAVLAVVIAIVYSTWITVPPYISHFLLTKEVQSELEFAHKQSDGKLRKYLLEKAVGMDLPITAEDIEIRRTVDEIELLIEYWVDLDYATLYQRELYFEIYHKAPIQPGGKYSPKY